MCIGRPLTHHSQWKNKEREKNGKKGKLYGTCQTTDFRFSNSTLTDIDWDPFFVSGLDTLFAQNKTLCQRIWEFVTDWSVYAPILQTSRKKAIHYNLYVSFRQLALTG